MSEILSNLFLQLAFTVGLVSAFGLIVWLLNKAFYKQMGRYGRKACLVTGFIGTPIHEIGHAFFCVIFGHKIIDIKLYQPNRKDGVLGYVNHSFNKKNIYHQVGNFFIGIGPIIFGSGALIALMYFFVPSLLSELIGTMRLLSNVRVDIFDASSIGRLFEVLWEVVITFFSISSLANAMWWLFMIPACSIALHMSLSVPDIKGSATGLTFIVVSLLILNLIFYLVNETLMWTLTDLCLKASSFILNFLMISILLSLILVAISTIIKAFAKLAKLKR